MNNDPMFEIKTEKNEAGYGKFIVSPLAQGYGLTLGNSLRRVLLISLPGLAVTSVKVDGVKHQFSTLSGMKEDMIEFILNLKKVRFSSASEGPFKGKIEAVKSGEVKASDIKVSGGAEVANKDLVLATLNKGAKLSCELTIEKGVGYSPAEERSEGTVGLMPIDAHFSPVVRVSYKVEETRVGKLTNFDKLNLEIWTDESVSPKDALTQASEILLSYFTQIVHPKKVEKKEVEIKDSLGPVGKLSVEEVGLPTRVANALVKAGYESVEDLVKADKSELVKVRNLGEKSLKIIAAALGGKGVDF